MAHPPEVSGPARGQNVNQDEFVANCRVLARRNNKMGGRIASLAAMSFDLRDYASHVYRDEVVEIVAEAEPMKAVLVRVRETGTPVVWVNGKGVIVRWDEEANTLFEHVQKEIVHGEHRIEAAQARRSGRGFHVHR